MAGMGTGYPISFVCPKARQIYWRTRTSRDIDWHQVTLTGRKRRAPGRSKGHPRKSDESREYRCRCGHVGWSCHKDLERMEQRDGRR